MPLYVYHCPTNGSHVEAWHPMDIELGDWGQLCYVARIPIGNTPPEAPVHREVTAPAISVPTGDSKLKELGFTKLVRRDEGVYENVTAIDSEQRYVKQGQKENNARPEEENK